MPIGSGVVLWRVHFTGTEHAVAWNRLRRHGPVETCRFDPHPAGAPTTGAEGVAYTALDVTTALAEVFQQPARIINSRRNAPQLTGFNPTRELTLLDLTGDWPLHAGASHVINTGRRDRCRAWARAFRAAWPHVDGLCHVSSMTGLRCVTLFRPAADALPGAPVG